MDLSTLDLPPNHHTVVNRFVAACEDDARIMAAFLGGSYVEGAADVYSDLDLYLITAEAAYDDFLAERETFVGHLGEPLFLEDFGTPYCKFFVLADGTEGELWIGSESRFTHIHGGPYWVLLDRQGILSDVAFPMHEADRDEQVETVRQQIYWFWHEMSHFIKAMGRGQLWFAYGELEIMRGMCVSLARLRHNLTDAYVGEEPYFKVEQAMPVEQLSPLLATYCPMEPGAMREAALVILRFYREAARDLAQANSLPYPDDLERLMAAAMEKWGE